MPDEALIQSREEFEALDWKHAKVGAFDRNFGEDREAGVFWGVLSELEFRRLHQVVEKSLEANGFETNLENILSALETLRLGRMARTQNAKLGPSVRQYQPVLCFELPRRGKSGELLSKLYGLIESLKQGAQVPVRHGQSPRESQIKAQELADNLRTERDELAKELAAVRAELEALRAVQLTHRLGDQGPKAIGVSHSRAETARLESAQVRSVDPSAARIVVRIGRRDFDVGYENLVQFPEPGAWSLALVTQGRIEALVPLGTGWRPMSYVVVTVLAATDQALKVRSLSGDEWCVPRAPGKDVLAQARPSDANAGDRGAGHGIRRGMTLVARTCGSQCLGVFRCDDQAQRKSVLENIQTLLGLQDASSDADLESAGGHG
jgi:hypothetical protein